MELLIALLAITSLIILATNLCRTRDCSTASTDPIPEDWPTPFSFI